MNDTNSNKGSDAHGMPWALKQTIALAESMVAKHQALMPFARPLRSDPWQRSEYQQFFLQDIYGALTGRKQACDGEIAALAVTPEAASWIAERCLNPYWFWALIGAAARNASILPLTLDNVHKGTRDLFEAHAEPMSRSIAVHNWPEGYSGGYKPWHLRDAFARAILWNNDSDREWGLQYGFLMLQRAADQEYRPLTRIGRQLGIAAKPMDGMRLLFNPLFDDLAVTPPVVAADK